LKFIFRKNLVWWNVRYKHCPPSTMPISQIRDILYFNISHGYALAASHIDL
jgi:hypothetical protein